MLVHLSVENYALIEQLEISFDRGFSVITGETGAGKSILLGALSLILGQRTDTGVLKEKAKKCIIEGTFRINNYGLESFFENNDLDYDKETLLRREINPNGKSRAFINDTPVTLNVLKSLTERLINVHSQYETLTLNDANFQLSVIDVYAGLTEKTDDFSDAYRCFVRFKKELDDLLEKEKQLRADKDYYQFLYDELIGLNLSVGEQEKLEQELDILNHAEEIKSNLYKVSNLLQYADDNLLDKMTEVRSILDNLTRYYPEIKNIFDRIDSSLIELKDTTSEIEKIEQGVNYDPARIEIIEERLNQIYKLEQKHQVKSDKDLIEVLQKIEQKLSEITSFDDKILSLQNKVHRNEIELRSLANKISATRKKALPEIENELINRIIELGMPEAAFKIDHIIEDAFTKDGFDKVRFLFNANRGGELKEISSIASGGERSRLMLGIKSMITKNNLLPTIIFDEIDLGVSGEIAGKMGSILQNMGNDMQVIALTHLPQIAGKGKNHFLVYKETDTDTTRSLIKRLNKQERITEIAKMLSDETITDAATKTAKELLDR